MDKLEAVRFAARNLDQAMDEELLATTPETKAQAHTKAIKAEAEYARALDALHEARTPGNDDDAQAPAGLERTG